jgi:hypothetical protein
MNLQINDDNAPSFIGWQYADGSIRVTVEGVGERVDGETLFTFTHLAGVEAGSSVVPALNDRADIIVFKGTYDEQRNCFAAWAVLANENDRRAILRREVMAALVRLDPVPMPPLPVIDRDATEHANEVLMILRQLLEEAEAKRAELSLKDCMLIVATAVGPTGCVSPKPIQ